MTFCPNVPKLSTLIELCRSKPYLGLVTFVAVHDKMLVSDCAVLCAEESTLKKEIRVAKGKREPSCYLATGKNDL